MLSEGVVELRDWEDWNQVLQPLRDPDMSLFTDDERFIIDDVFERLRKFNATSASDYSHTNSPGWNATDDFEDIPYETARVGVERPPEHVFEFFRQLHGIKS